MKFALVFGLFFIVFNCAKPDDHQASQLLLSCNYNAELDTTYNEENDRKLISALKKDTLYKMTPIDGWEEGIFIIGQGGWEEFEYYCSVYDDRKVKKIEISYRTESFGIDSIVPFQYHTEELSHEEFNEIIEDFERINFCNYPYDLEPNSMILDGPAYVVVSKSVGKTKTVTWQGQGSRGKRSQKRDQLILLCKKLLRRAAYPLPKAYVYQSMIGRDSVEMAAVLLDETVLDSLVFEYKNLVENEFLLQRIAIHDTTLFKKNLRIIAYLGGKTYYPPILYVKDEK